VTDAYAGRRVLVTGGAGFVGAALARRLSEHGAEVTVLDDLTTGRDDALPDEVTLVRGSVTDPEAVSSLVAAHPLVFHLAARGILASTSEPRRDFETNAGGTLNLLLAARRCKVDRIVYASSASVYGNARTTPMSEDDRPAPLSPYAVSKLTGEHYCLACAESYGLPVAVLRYSNVYGPDHHTGHAYSGVVTKFVSSVVGGRPMQVHGDGLQTRDFTFIDDVVDATLIAGRHPRAEGHVFNVGTGVETSVLDLAGAVAMTLGADAEIEHIPRREIDNIRRRRVNVEKIRGMLGWSPRVPLDAGLRRTVESLAASSARR
jgi:UDP-glucose 4-epimerase